MAEVTGTQVLRRAVATRNTKANLATSARDIGVSSDALFSFSTGATDLAPDRKQALAAELWGNNNTFNVALDRLRPTDNAPGRRARRRRRRPRSKTRLPP
jgi:hypothetical protein